MKSNLRFGTRAIHAGQEPDPSTGAIMTPIYQTSTFVQESPGKHKGYAYARGKNPTRVALEKCIASLENAKHGLCFGSGQGAEDAIIKLLRPGDEVLATDDLYGGSYRMFVKVFEPLGISFRFVNMHDASKLKSELSEKTRMIWIETPTNPLMKIIDIKKCVEAVAGKNIIIVVDNTFASPYLQNPLDLGAHIVTHSATKYLSGHSDVVHGALCTNDDKLHEQLAFIANSCGAVPGPMDSFLVMRGLKTLHVRMERHCSNGKAVAEFLRNHPKVDKVYWPGFSDHPNHAIAKSQMKDFGGMISFTLKGNSMEEAFAMASRTKVFSLAESLGGVESLIGHPASMTHASIPAEIRQKSGVLDSLLRLSVGIEDVEDLIEDLRQAIG
ncbi:MAG: cystathionine gamma-synthase [Bacteroidetes bacterium]|nr:MAG: cystathionine gamma-synthase [Bacteroidota bacterium]REK00662.1 MAG: cystathionine gamma-synthase [Bacteroidota bacterium]REK35216.1 MAG: cystathionine gamma-synthase [Bacteroidota bacterium]REK48293.1 MAG: cystathionine gamma-synthase [Bacteroidota bacterium]